MGPQNALFHIDFPIKLSHFSYPYHLLHSLITCNEKFSVSWRRFSWRSNICVLRFAHKTLTEKKFVVQVMFAVQINNIRQSMTQILFYIQWYIYQGDMFRPSRSSSGPPRLGRNMSP